MKASSLIIKLDHGHGGTDPVVDTGRNLYEEERESGNSSDFEIFVGAAGHQGHSQPRADVCAPPYPGRVRDEVRSKPLIAVRYNMMKSTRVCTATSGGATSPTSLALANTPISMLTARYESLVHVHQRGRWGKIVRLG
jgi:hypothetical protein